MSKRVLVAMSGGVDSSAAAALLIKQGYQVAGATMLLTDAGMDAVRDARQVADTLGIPHETFDFRAEFDQTVIRPFIAEYLAGRTPNPCVMCNRTVKFGAFLDKALALGYEYIATGHYARIAQENGRFSLYKAASTKDQSYVLYTLTERQLAHVLLPVCNYDKPALRTIADEMGLAVAGKPDSQEICFIPEDDYIRFIEMYSPSPTSSCAGRFVDMNGRDLGTHQGYYRYTVGQRKGLGSFGARKFVVQVDAKSGNVILGEDADVYADALHTGLLHFMDGSPPANEFDCLAKIRYNAADVAARAKLLTDGSAQIIFSSPARAVTPGQSVVLYDGNRVLGGGIIKEACKIR